MAGRRDATESWRSVAPAYWLWSTGGIFYVLARIRVIHGRPTYSFRGYIRVGRKAQGDRHIMKFLTVPISEVMLTGTERVKSACEKTCVFGSLSMYCRQLVRPMGLYSSLRHPLWIEVWRCRAAQDTIQTR